MIKNDGKELQKVCQLLEKAKTNKEGGLKINFSPS